MAPGGLIPYPCLRQWESQEWAARLFIVLLLVTLPLAIIAAGRPRGGAIVLHASMPETGGWQPGHLSAGTGEPLRLRLTSADVVHGFAVGAGPDGRAHNSAEVEIRPGQVTELTLTFDEPGIYTFYCTRWCGPNHWRMRGTIQVSDPEGGRGVAPAEPPLYAQLGLDIDGPHPVPVRPGRIPSPARGAELDLAYPQELLAPYAYMTQSPVEMWLTLRALPELSHLGDSDLWDAVASIWRLNTTGAALELGRDLYSRNCAACHGETGRGDGVFASAGPTGSTPAFTDPALLAASNALLQGKIIRGGMGTGMPAWGTIFTDEELQSLLDYLWTFQFLQEAG